MRLQKIHPVQQKLLELLKVNFEDPLTVRELQAQLGVSSTSVVVHHINQLEKKGYIKRNPYNPRDYQVLRGGPEKPVTYLNLYGLAHCGPHGSVLDGNPIDRIAVSTRLLSFPSAEAFMVKAKGDSMEPRIHEGDLVISKKTSSAQNGEVVVCVNNGEVLIKKFVKRPEGKILVSLNSEYSPILPSKDFRIEGIVKGLISQKLS